MEPNHEASPVSLEQPKSKIVLAGPDEVSYYEKSALEDICDILFLDTKEPEYSKTPERAAKWFKSFARKPNYEGDKETFLSVAFPSPHNELVWQEGLSFVSLCPHHLLPYSGTGAIAYIPNGGVVGISKLSRALEYWTHYPVKQEDATANLADALMKYIKPQPLGCMVVLKAKHACMAFRGVEEPDHMTGTSAVRGCFESDPSGARQEFLRLANL